MSITLSFGLVFQLAALVVVLRVVRSRLLLFSGAVLIVMLCIFHGLTEIANILYPGADFNRMVVDQDAVDRWVLMVGAAILLFSAAYTWTVKRDRRFHLKGPAPAQPKVNLPVLFAVAIPAYALTATAGIAQYDYGAYGYWLAGLSQDLSLFATVMLFVALILRCPQRWTMVLLGTEAFFIAILGSRLSLIVVFVMTTAAITRYGRPVKFRHICVGLLLLAAVTGLISSSRIYYGREIFRASVGERVSNIGRSGIAALGDSELDLKGDYLYRFDCNVFPTLINERFREGFPGVGLRSFANNFLLYIPSYFNVNKLDSAVESRNERAYVRAQLGIKDIDLATTLFTVLFSYYGATGLMFCAAGLGVVFARLDGWVNSSTSQKSYVAGLCLAYCCVVTEQGVSVYFYAFRAGVVLLLVINAGSRIRRSVRVSRNLLGGRALSGLRGPAPRMRARGLSS